MPQPTPKPEAKSSGWTDREIYRHDQDRLKFDHYAGVLAEIIREADTPLTLGVFGPWGSGKTSLLRLIKDALDEGDGESKSRTLWFDAWTFDKEDALWRALILLVLKTLRKELPADSDDALKKLDDLEASLYRDVDRQEAGGVTLDWEKTGKAAVSGLTRLTLSLVPGIGTFLAKTAEEAQKQLSGGTLDSLFDAVQRKRREIHREHIESLEQFQQGFAELLKEHFLRKDRRLVVFIDDLDRCLPEKAISVLEAIKLFLDAPGCVYVIGADRDVIEQGIRVKYKDFFVGEAAATPITGDFYLEKIIQIPFHMPPLQEERIRDFIDQYDESVPDDCAAILAIGIEPNPRKVKRTINVFRLLRKLAERRVAEKEIDQFDPGLLAKIVVIQSRWRGLYADLLEYPNLIQDLEQHFRAGDKKPGRPIEAGQPGAPAEADFRPDLPARGAPPVEAEQQTLLERHAISKALGKMLRLPPYFEGLEIDQIQLYLYMTHTVEAEVVPEAEVFNVDARRWEDLLSNDLTKIRAATAAIQAESQVEAHARQLVGMLSGGKDFALQQRASAGNALAELGDLRFRPDAWHLPDEPLLGFVEIPAGPFLMGSDPQRDKQADEREQPQHQVTLPAYYIARFPVTVAQFQAFVDSSGYKPADENSLRGVPNYPVVRVTWHDARAYGDWLSETLRKWEGTPNQLARLLREKGWRVVLPSEAEWEKAARGDDGRIFPWGDEPDPDRANYSESNVNDTSAVGCFPRGASPYGCLDMSGNVWEWTRSTFKDYPYRSEDGREDLKTDAVRVLRGGAFYDYAGYVRCAARIRNYPSGWYPVGGFRGVVASPF